MLQQKHRQKKLITDLFVTKLSQGWYITHAANQSSRVTWQ